MNIVKVAEYSAPKAILRKDIDWLKDYVYLGHPDNTDSAVRIALVRDDYLLSALDGSTQINEKYQLSYSDWMGYQSSKDN